MIYQLVKVQYPIIAHTPCYTNRKIRILRKKIRLNSMSSSESRSAMSPSFEFDTTRENTEDIVHQSHSSFPASRSSNASFVQKAFMHIRRYNSLIGALLSFGLFTAISLSAYRSRDSLSSFIVYFWLIVSMILSLFIGMRLMWRFMDRTNCLASISSDPNGAMICTVEVCIANETVLTVRSWWPLNMSRGDIEKHGVRVAMSSAQRWIGENSNPGGKMTRVRFTEETAAALCDLYTCNSVVSWEGCGSGHNQCSVCLDDIETGCVEMKKCGHTFHSQCLTSWFSQSSRLVCPMCRTDHHSTVPQSVYMDHIIKENPVVSILSISLEEGTLST